MFRWGNRTSHLGRMKNSSYYIAPVGDRTHDLPHTVASNMVKVSHALNHSATEAVVNGMNKHALLQLISGRLREKGCLTIQAEGDAELEMVKAAVAMSAYKSITLIGEDTDLLVLLLYHAAANDCKDL